MPYRRQPRKNGEMVELGGVTYRFDSVEGLGGSSIVYKASYEDELNRSFRHQVFIKELFPLHPKGAIYRGEDGEICCAPQGRELMEFCRQRFRQGNEVNLELLGQMPAQVSGNINSYEAYGTYYSVLAVHGGESLEAVLEEGARLKDLRDAVKVLGQILDALECFHRNGLLHLDISPDNICLLPEQVLLIDYNSAWSIGDVDCEEFTFSEKAGYSAPEVYLRNIREIGFSTDLYSVCAVFFRMLMGRPLSEKETIGNGLKQCFAQKIPMLEEAPESASYKVFQIIMKGLHVLSRKRYQSVGELRQDLEELTERLDKMGVSHSALWESSRALFRKKHREQPAFLPRSVSFADGSILPEEELAARLQEGGRILLAGADGMGKTSLLTWMWGQGVRSYLPKAPAVFYVSLKEYQISGEEPAYIRRCLLRHLERRNRKKSSEDALRELEQLLSTDLDGRVQLILLLDGLDEAGSRRSLLLREIEELGSMPGVAILVTDRSDEVRRYALKSFQTSRLLPLCDETVQKELQKSGTELPVRSELRERLSDPMSLRLYRDILSMEKETGAGAGEFDAGSDLVRAYFQRLLQTQLRLYSEDETAQLAYRYLLEHLLPDIAGMMAGRKCTLLSPGDVHSATKRSYRNLRKKCFAEFRPMLRRFSDVSEWFDFAVNGQLVGNFRLLSKSDGGYYGLAHNVFQEYLTEVFGKNRAVYLKRMRIVWFGRGLALAVGVSAAVFGLYLLSERAPVGEPAVSADEAGGSPAASPEEDLTAEAERCLKQNLGTLCGMIGMQRTLLDMAGDEGTLKGEKSSVASYAQTKSEAFATDYKAGLAEPGPGIQEALLRADPDYPMDYFDFFYSEPDNLYKIWSTAFIYLDLAVLDTEEERHTAEERRKMIEAYESYLDAYAEYVFCVADYALFCMDSGKAEAILDDLPNNWVLQKSYIGTQLSGQDTEEILRAIKDAGDRLREAQSEMNDSRYRIVWGDLL